MKWAVDQRWLATARLLAASGLMLSAEEWESAYGFDPMPEWVVEAWRASAVPVLLTQYHDYCYEQTTMYLINGRENQTRWYRDMTLALMAEIYCTMSPP